MHVLRIKYCNHGHGKLRISYRPFQTNKIVGSLFYCWSTIYVKIVRI